MLRPLPPDRDRCRLAGAGPRLERGRGGDRERALGYVAFATFLIDQLVWIGLILATLLIAMAFGDEFTTGALGGETRIATILQANTGLRRRSLQQIALLANGIGRIVLIIAAIMLALAPWGVDSADLLGSVRAAFFGFRVGEVTISLATVVLALLIFAIGFAVTRIIQGWLDTTFLPATDLDAGLRNSIRTAFGYLGFFVAAALAFSYLGLSLDRIAIVAGALSVGIGFGLQSIVNNFVSGLILLWERPIRVGDLVVVGDGEGHVRRISVRSTEIETFDRSTLIVPNSNLISGVVKNRVRTDRTGRVIDLDQRAAQPGSGARRRAPGALRRHASGRAQGAAAAGGVQEDRRHLARVRARRLRLGREPAAERAERPQLRALPLPRRGEDHAAARARRDERAGTRAGARRARPHRRRDREGAPPRRGRVGHAATGSQRKPSPHGAMRPAEGEGKCAVQHRVPVSQNRSRKARRVRAARSRSKSNCIDSSG